jgi:hypothetical protein
LRKYDRKRSDKQKQPEDYQSDCQIARTHEAIEGLVEELAGKAEALAPLVSVF